MAYTFSKRVGPTKYSQVKSLKYYTSMGSLNPFEINSATGGNCTWWAWGRFLEVMAVAGQGLKWTYGAGNACSFYRIMTNKGLSGGLVPKPGAIACWGYNGKSEGNPGHVAFVEAVNTDGSIEISQSGWSSGPLNNQTLKPGTGGRGTGAYKLGYLNSYFNGFIYNPVDFGNPLGIVNTTGRSKDWYISKYGTGAEVYFELQKYGYSHKACCAVLGNMQQESGIRVYTGGSYDGNGSEGLCQWTFGRKTAMINYATSHSANGTWKSVDGQVAYLVYELEHSEKSANKVLKNDSLTLDEMTVEFEKTFERAGVPMFDKRKKYAHEWDEKMAGAAGAEGENLVVQSVINMRQRINKLYTSDNYEYAYPEGVGASETEKAVTAQVSTLKDQISKISFDNDLTTTSAFPEPIIKGGFEAVQRIANVKVKSTLDISKALIQAPFVELNIGGYIIGSYKGSLDDYPNYISQLDVKKINGEINQYTINVVYQIRPGEDPNLLDKLFSKVRYNKISIRYGDCESGSLFKDTEAIITNIVNSRDYASSRISYTIYATSACNYVTSVKFNFSATQDKPSNIIRNLLYNNVETSNLLLEAFPGMRDRYWVESNNLIPDNDTVLNIAAKVNTNTLSYINYLVGCMSNNTNSISDVIRNSNYFIIYQDDTENGSYFKINEVTKTNKTSVLTNNVYEITVGFPDGNDVYNFQINNSEAWSMLYDHESVSSEYLYGINSQGTNTITYSPNLSGSSNILNEIQKNWWTQMTTFPISAQLTLRGLLKPISLMDYIQINVVFYGQKHITSGLYVVTGEQDILSGSGFLTNLSLLRVGD